MTDKHTATPWEVDDNFIISKNDKGFEKTICAAINKTGVPETDYANAAHIVHCVNNHDALVEALDILLSHYIIHFQSHANCGDIIHKTNIELAEAALKAAKGE